MKLTNFHFHLKNSRSMVLKQDLQPWFRPQQPCLFTTFPQYEVPQFKTFMSKVHKNVKTNAIIIGQSTYSSCSWVRFANSLGITPDIFWPLSNLSLGKWYQINSIIAFWISSLFSKSILAPQKLLIEASPQTWFWLQNRLEGFLKTNLI